MALTGRVDEPQSPSQSHTLALSFPFSSCLQNIYFSPQTLYSKPSSCYRMPSFPSLRFRVPGFLGRTLGSPVNRQSLLYPAFCLGENKHSGLYPSPLPFSYHKISFYDSSHCSNSLFYFGCIFALVILALAIGQVLTHRIILMKN